MIRITTRSAVFSGSRANPPRPGDMAAYNLYGTIGSNLWQATASR